MIIRKAILSDAACIAPCLLLAMEEIVYGFIGSDDHSKAAGFLLHFVQQANNQYSYENCWVAEVDETVVAAANVYDGAKLQELRQPVIDYIRTNFRPGFLPEDETGPGEFYIDSIGVDPHHTGKGVGSALLQFLIAEYITQHRQTLGLLVEAENPNARRLYLKMGFETAGRKPIFGKDMEHLQIRS